MDRRRGSRLGAWAVGLFVVLAAAGLPQARADVFIPDPPDIKRVPVAIELDWGPLAKVVSRPHVVVRGETLRALATRYYGEASAWPVIVKANPARIEPPDGIQAGVTLWIPPQTDVPYEAFWVTRARRLGPGWRVLQRASPADPASLYQRGGALMFLPADDAAPVIASLERKVATTWEATPPGAHLAFLGGDDRAAVDDPVARRVVTYRLLGFEGDAVQSALTIRNYAADDSVVQAPPEVAVKAATSGALAPVLLLASDVPVEEPVVDRVAQRWPALVGVLLALVGLVLVVGVALRRRRAAATGSEDAP